MKDYNKVLEEINNITIENVPKLIVTDEQKNKVRKNLFKSIESLKERNKELNINISEEGIMDIKNALGEKAEDYLNGVKHGRVLRDVTLKAVRDEVISKYGEVEHETFATNAYGTTNIGFMAGGALYFKIFITKEKLITYSFSEFYKVVDKVEVKIKNIKGAGLYEDNIYYIEYADKIIYLGYTLEKTKVELDNIMETLENKGIENNSYNKKRNGKMITIIYIVIVIILMTVILVLNTGWK
ncbi:MAG: hypothetical protein ACRDA5_09065 [Clostridium sp.]